MNRRYLVFGLGAFLFACIASFCLMLLALGFVIPYTVTLLWLMIVGVPILWWPLSALEDRKVWTGRFRTEPVPFLLRGPISTGAVAGSMVACYGMLHAF
jgi:hypothetical protein